MNSAVGLARRPLDLLDNILDRITSYRLVLYVLVAEYVLGVIMAAAGQVPFRWSDMLASAALLVAVSYFLNSALARLLNIPKNLESDYITGLILVLILTPAATRHDYAILAIAAAAAQVSKYVLVLGRRHIFNPAAVGAAVAGLAFHHYASWWIGTSVITPLVVLGGILILRKMKRYIMVIFFLAVYLAVIAIISSGPHLGQVLWLAVSASPLLFFGTVMLTEPQTSPTKWLAYLPYVLLTAVLFGVTKLHLTPEEALLAGNVLAYILEPSRRIKLTFVKRLQEADGIYSYLFTGSEDIKYQPGQYMEWTLPLSQSDRRGNRRYFTIASAPEENQVMFAVKMPAEKPSAFKARLNKFKTGDRMLAAHPAGSFTLPDDGRRVVLVAGGIGVTPYRSIIKHLMATGQQRRLTLLYAAGRPAEFAFKELWASAKRVGLKTIYLVTSEDAPRHWGGHRGRLDAVFIKSNVPAYADSTFYISGPYGFVKSVRAELTKLGVAQRRIVTDYFPGYN